MYYRLYDTDTKQYLRTGSNSESKKDLFNDFLGFLGNIEFDFDDDFDNKVSSLIAVHGFIIEESEIPFPTIYCTNCLWEGIDEDLISVMVNSVGKHLPEIIGCCPICKTDEFIEDL